MRHPCGVLDQALDAAERLRELEDLRPRDEADGFFLRLDEEGDHSAEVAHLPRRDLVAGMRRQARVEHLLDAWVAREPQCNRVRVLAVLAHPHRERLDATEDEPAVERPWHGAERLLQELQALRD